MKNTFVIPVFNAVDFAEKCIQSVLNQDQDCSMVVVNDGSSEETTLRLESLAAEHSEKITLLQHSQNKGYTKSVNAGISTALREGATNIGVLNSDAEIPTDFLAKAVKALQSNSLIGIVSPLSNAASHQSIPEVHTPDRNAFSINESFTSQWSIEAANTYLQSLCEQHNTHTTVTCLYNGFCSLVRKEVFEEVGLFDETLFPVGYGEETDFALRVEEHGWITQILLNTYVLHHKSKSFGSERKRQLSKQGHEKLMSRYSTQRLKLAEQSIARNAHLSWVRESLQQAILDNKLSQS